MEKENRTTNTEKKERKKDYILNIIIVQLIVCCMMFTTALILKKTNQRTFNEIKEKFATAMSVSFTKDDAKQTFKSVSNYIFMPVNELTKGDNEENTTETEQVSAAESEEVLGIGGGEIEKLAESARASFSRYYISNKITVPVHGKISSPYGYRKHPITGEESFHGGIDIAAKEGTRISAAYYGQIIETGYNKSAGNYIVMDHGEGVKTLYMHCSKICVSTGNVIRAGETIGYVGSTGASTGPHLHFEIRINNIRHDPAYILPIENNEV